MQLGEGTQISPLLSLPQHLGPRSSRFGKRWTEFTQQTRPAYQKPKSCGQSRQQKRQSSRFMELKSFTPSPWSRPSMPRSRFASRTLSTPITTVNNSFMPSFSGAKVPSTNLGLWSKTTKKKGTLIVPAEKRSQTTQKGPTAVTVKNNVTLINVASNRKSLAHGFMANIFSILEHHGIALDLVSTSEVFFFFFQFFFSIIFLALRR